MLHRDIRTLQEVGREIIYIDELTGETINGIVAYIEQVDPYTAFVYIASPYKDENNKREGNILYKDIMVFDNRPNTIEGWHQDVILGNYKSTPNK